MDGADCWKARQSNIRSIRYEVRLAVQGSWCNGKGMRSTLTWHRKSLMPHCRLSARCVTYRVHVRVDRSSSLHVCTLACCHTPYWQSVGLHWWSVVLDEVQPAAGQSVEDGGALVFFQSTSAPDPDLACAYRQHLCTTGHFRLWSRALHRLWRQLTDTRHRHRQIVLRCLT